MGTLNELQKDLDGALKAYERVLAAAPKHAKALQQLGWLYHQPETSFSSHETSISCLSRSLDADNTDPLTWYLLGRAHMADKKYNEAYEAYQQAVYFFHDIDTATARIQHSGARLVSCTFR